MDVTIRQSDDLESSGTELVGKLSKISSDQLTQLFGAPHYQNCDKVKTLWELTIVWRDQFGQEEQVVVTVYDFKDSDLFLNEFHVGGHGYVAFDCARAMLSDKTANPDQMLTENVKAQLMEIGAVYFPHLLGDNHA